MKTHFRFLQFGEAEITGGTKVKWIQLWEGGPKFAEYNVGATSATDYGGRDIGFSVRAVLAE